MEHFIAILKNKMHWHINMYFLHMVTSESKPKHNVNMERSNFRGFHTQAKSILIEFSISLDCLGS